MIAATNTRLAQCDMCEEGDRWQGRLASHFSELHARRSSGRALFALEHGLDEAELGSIRRVLVDGAPSRTERASHWLLWVVHATEVAYEYAGDEFWQSFERQTPGWDNRLANRACIRLFHSQAAGRAGTQQAGSHTGPRRDR